MNISDNQYKLIKTVCLIVITASVLYIAFNIPRIINVLTDIALAS